MNGTIEEIGSDLSKLKSFGVDRVIFAMNAEKNYDVNETIEFLVKLKSSVNRKLLNIIYIDRLINVVSFHTC